MRRFLLVLLALTVFVGLATVCNADAGILEQDIQATVSPNGSCQVMVTATIRLDEAVESMYFPVPKGATGVMLNGGWARTVSQDDMLLVDLSGIVRGVTGTCSVTIHYTLHNTVAVNDLDLLELNLELLSGFAHPIDRLSFTVTLPGPVDATPTFSSGYHLSRIEENLTVSGSESTVTGKSDGALKDHETLIMTMQVPEEMFPGVRQYVIRADIGTVGMIVCGVLALLYYIFFLRCFPGWIEKNPNPPEGCTAGHVASVLTGRGVDLSMLVFSWAQLGYILIQIDRHDRVLLHKRMEMGNERSAFEQRAFQKLFAKRQSVDCGSYHYVSQQKKAAASGAVLGQVHPKSGNPRLFRGLVALIGAFAGATLGFNMAQGALVQVLLAILFALPGALLGWVIQLWAVSLVTGRKQNMWICLGLCAVPLLVSAIAGQFGTGVLITLAFLLAGVLGSFGGRRTEEGKQMMAQVLGLRRYFRQADPKQIAAIMQVSGDYFHQLAPYALALGVEERFARSFGNQRLPSCPYLTTGMDGHMTAQEWSQLMRRTRRAMNARNDQLPLERIKTFIHNLTK